MKNVEFVSFQKHGDERGQLVALEAMKEVPFVIKRVYYAYDTADEVIRGRHAHRTLEQIIFCIHGSCKADFDNGSEKMTVSLDRPYEGIYVKGLVWRELYDFSPDAVLLVLASELYDEKDYIRDYNEFTEAVLTY